MEPESKPTPQLMEEKTPEKKRGSLFDQKPQAGSLFGNGNLGGGSLFTNKPTAETT